MNNAPQDPYRPFGEPEEPTWGSAASGEEPPPLYPQYPQYAPPPPPGAYPPPYGAQPGYGVDPYAGQYSDKNKTTAGLLQLLLPFVGICGVGRLYAGHTAIGITQLVGAIVSFCASAFFIGLPFLVGIWLWTVIDGIIMLSNESRDGQGLLMRS